MRTAAAPLLCGGQFRPLGRFVHALVLALWTWSGVAGAAQPTVAELKAAYIYNFARYVEWPTTAAHLGGEDFGICLAGSADEALFAALSQFDGKSIRSHSIRVRQLAAGDELKACAMMVIAKTDAQLVERLLRRLDGVPVLTVSSADNFLDLGGMINLVTDSDKVRFDINLGAARSNDLVVTFQLLKLARTVRQP